jgi:heat shock protein HslJ
VYRTILSRRRTLALGAALVALSLFGATRQSVGAQSGPAPAQLPQPSSPTPPSASTLTGVIWLWQRTEYGDGTTVAAPDPSRYTLALTPDGALSLQADCNRGSGQYTVDGSRLTLQPRAITLAICGPGSQDAVFLRDLQRVTSYVLDGESLALNLTMDSGTMYFTPQPPASLTGAAWRVQSVNNGRGGVASVFADTRLSATFGDDGTVTGETGCNTYRGPYTLDGATIAFGPLITTRRACLSEQAAAQEQAFTAALAASARYELAGDRLTLRDANGATQVILVRA